ncbi:helix-turn-helix transcriptional regulator, partial [Acinetobacter baumannii]
MRAKLSDKCHIDVRAIRQSRSIKQRELAASTGLGVNALMKIERGLTTLTPQLELVFAEAFNLSLAELRAFSRSRESGEGYVTAK